MAVRPYVSFEAFLSVSKVLNRSSRVYTRYLPSQPSIGLTLSVADAFLRDVAGVSLVLSVADATFRDIATSGPELTFDPTLLVFADTTIGEYADAELLLSNTGDEPLIITLISTSGDFSLQGLA